MLYSGLHHKPPQTFAHIPMGYSVYVYNLLTTNYFLQSENELTYIHLHTPIE